MNLGIFEDSGVENLLPLTWLRAAFELRCGRDRLLDKISSGLGEPVCRLWVRDTISEVVSSRAALASPLAAENWCLFNARAFVTRPITPPAAGTAWVRDGALLAIGLDPQSVEALGPDHFLDDEALRAWLGDFAQEQPPEGVQLVRYPWDLIAANRGELVRQGGGEAAIAGQVYPGAHLVAQDSISIGARSIVKPGSVLDAESGPIVIDRDVQIQPGAVISGPCYIGPRTIIRPGAVLRDGVSIGENCRVGGEVEGSVLHGFANKQHDGFLGHSYVAEWVNLGAGTITSDLKNTYGTIRVPINGVGVESGQRFIGALIGDHTKTAIGVCLPTGCVIGVASNVLTRLSVPTFVPSFAWLSDEGLSAYRVEKAVQIARGVMSRRERELGEAERRLLEQTVGMAREVEAAGW